MSWLKVSFLPQCMQIKSLMDFFEGGELEHRVMEKSGCLNYSTTPWEFVRPDIFQRCISYQFNHSISIFEGRVTCIQQKHPMAAGSVEEEWVLNEVMSLHDVPFGDHFRVCEDKSTHLVLLCSFLLRTSMMISADPFSDILQIHFRYCFEDSVLAKDACKCKAFYGITWLKNVKIQQKIARNIAEEFEHRLKVMFEMVEREILLATQQQNSIS